MQQMNSKMLHIGDKYIVLGLRDDHECAINAQVQIAMVSPRIASSFVFSITL